MNEHIEFLTQLELMGAENHVDELYLWPRTPIANLQAEAWQRVGVSDWRADDERSRPAQVLRVLEDLTYNRLISEQFSYLDICCGDGVILWHVRRTYPFATVCGVDLADQDTHVLVQESGVKVFRIAIQRLFKTTGPRFDVVTMFNTYRGWTSADLREDEKWLVDAVDEWLRRNARFAILTVGRSDVGRRQVETLKGRGFWVTEVGTAEDRSTMILVFPCDAGEGLWSQQRR